jgi:membrane-bound lytic murein transglycosylase A
MQLNPRYAFFRLAPDDGRPPVGAAGSPLPAGRAVAVDRAWHQMGELLWIDAEAPLLQGAFPTYRRLVVALDTGGAIQGPVRADLYLGQGDAAGAEAGRVRHALRLYRMIPRAGAAATTAGLGGGAASP